ncbi:hypothetical protein CCACVL1_20066 [Corchorus capsularis]|uniref:Uncharacterized protein n=1 Tax=Corchorus capsularis TaxID=210143 RepID=A0A1R3HCQ6_COCAP|nr:hypothetical protein CCACVL1_20066 [Corchorus capsularis]
MDMSQVYNPLVESKIYTANVSNNYP